MTTLHRSGGTPSLARQESSVRHLQALYTIVAGLALSDAIGWLFREGRTGGPGPWELLPLLVAFVVTLVPFFHGALRHLDDSYLIDPAARTVKRGALATDFVFLFGESCLLFALAHRMDRAGAFLALFALLLLVDVAWAVAFHLATPTSRRRTPDVRALLSPRGENPIFQLRWAANNVAFLLVVGCWAAVLGVGPDANPHLQRAATMAIAVARTASDYRVSWDFYFPPAPDADRDGAA